jgi:hypothetical protein
MKTSSSPTARIVTNNSNVAAMPTPTMFNAAKVT